MVYINGHYLQQKITGVQRYAHEVVKEFSRLNFRFELVEIPPLLSKNKITHHVWEQLLLPMGQKGPLWSPTNTGPILHSNHIITLHDVAVYENPQWFSKKYRTWRKFLIPYLAKGSKHILTVSNFSKEVIVEKLNVSPDKITVAYNGVNRDRFRRASGSEVELIKRRYGITKKYILILGSLDPRKNLIGALKAWRMISGDMDDMGIELVVAGGMNANFNNMTVGGEAFNNINRIGYVKEEDLSILYSGAECFLFPSLFEGFGLPILEAMSCEVPVITSDFGAMKEIAGNAALLIDSNSENEIKDNIIQLIGDNKKREKYVEKGKINVQKYSWGDTAQTIYRKLITFK